ncbi:class I SAM-dependent RNA methyltransferase [Candidatus Saccharibacteria bacterium]|nr:class I SAM-dependent RNA methyltransferase [Candidatus Saccharibacteria bacterium]
MKQQTVLDTNISVDRLVPGGQGIGTLPGGKKAFLWNTLPGETVTEFLVTKKKSHYIEGIATKFENPSKFRVEPKDTCYLSTSPWQILDYTYELEQKRALVAESLRQEHVAVSDGVEIKPTGTDGKQWFYRNKMEYSLFWAKEDSMIHLAFHARGSHQKFPIEKSSIEKPEIFSAAKQIVDELNRNREDSRKYQSMLLRASSDGTVSGGLFENRQPHPIFNNLKDTILGQTYSYSPNGFFQINLPVYELALKEIKQHIKTDKVLDLYSGVGTIGLSVARDKDLTLVESDKSAYRELENNCQGTTATPVFAKSEDALEYIAPDLTVILDPPRAGCEKKLILKLLDETPEKIIYLSCNPSTQSRDVKLLESKYIIEQIAPFNFFPKTPHIENLIVLRRKESVL